MDITIQANECLTKSLTVRPNDKTTDLLVLTIEEFAIDGQRTGVRFVMDRQMWQQAVDHLADLGVRAVVPVGSA